MASPGPETLLRPLLRSGRRVGAALLHTALCCICLLECAVPTALLRTGRRVGAAGPADSMDRSDAGAEADVDAGRVGTGRRVGAAGPRDV